MKISTYLFKELNCNCRWMEKKPWWMEEGSDWGEWSLVRQRLIQDQTRIVVSDLCVWCCICTCVFRSKQQQIWRQIECVHEKIKLRVLEPDNSPRNEIPQETRLGFRERRRNNREWVEGGWVCVNEGMARNSGGLIEDNNEIAGPRQNSGSPTWYSTTVHKPTNTAPSLY